MSDEATETIEVEEPNYPGKKPSIDKKQVEEETAWFSDDVKGHHFIIELNGKHFKCRELDKTSVKQITKRIRELGKTQKAIQNKNRKAVDDLKKLEKSYDAESNSDDPDWDKVDLIREQISDLEDVQERLGDEAEPLIDEQNSIFEKVCLDAIKRWDLPQEISEDSIKRLSNTARRNIGDVILSNSVAGGDRFSFTGKR